MSENRFDVIYNEKGCSIDYHFCREWEGDDGCYGTNPDHGFTWDEARNMVADYYENRAKEWRTKEEKDYFIDIESMEDCSDEISGN